MDEKEKIKEVVKEREEKIELLNRSFDEKDKLMQDLESRFVLIAVLIALRRDFICVTFIMFGSQSACI